MENLLERRKKEFRAVGLAIFVSASGLLLLRIIFNLIGDSLSETLTDCLFSTSMQIGVLLLGTFLSLKLYLRRPTKRVLEYTNFRKPSLAVMLLCFPFGICVLVATIGVSTVWVAILMGLGYEPGSGTPMPEKFSLGLLLINIFLTGVLPGICEEFTNRGALLTGLRNTFSKRVTIVLCGIAFGLFHQNITQVFYASLFGMLMAYLTLESKSIFPAMVVHFTNNAVSVYSDFATSYDIFLSGFFNWLSETFVTNFALIGILFVLTVALGVFLYIVIIKLSRKHYYKQTGGIRVLDEYEEETPLAPTTLYKPSLGDWAFYIGALVMTALTTVATFVWGL